MVLGVESAAFRVQGERRGDDGTGEPSLMQILALVQDLLLLTALKRQV